MDRPGALARLGAVVGTFADQYLPHRATWAVALSGGPDSLALTAVAARIRPTTALIVDHGLQSGSAQVARTARDQALKLGCVDAQIIAVSVGTHGGPEAAARTARYAALADTRRSDPVLLAHTLDDQAETVLLGLGRGSGARSIAGMQPLDAPWCRPLLGVRRSSTWQACAELGLTPWIDPHNNDARFTRARLRSDVLPLLENVLGGGVAEALARTAHSMREVTELIDDLAHQALVVCTVEAALDVAALAELAGPVRRAVIRRWLLTGGGRGVTDVHIRAVERLVTCWRGQGGVAIGSSLRQQRLFAVRSGDRLQLCHEPI